MLKKCVCMLLALLLLLLQLPVLAEAEEELVPIYLARMAKESKMRAEPSTSAKYICTVPAAKQLHVLEWGEEWSLCEYEGKRGYLLTNRIYELWRLGETPLPGMIWMTGVAEITKATHVEQMDKSSGDLFSGLTLQPGNIVAAVDDQGNIPFRRFVMTLPEGTYTFRPFVAVDEAADGDLIYAFTTYYNDRVGGNMAQQRRHNIDLAVERITGTVLQPGEQFSFNELCAPYRVNNGYVKAPNISQSGYGVGGGVCQVSTTVFEAVLGLELQLDMWEVHQVIGVRYAPLNYDAAVGGRKDLKFTNNLPYPIRLEVLTQGGALTAFFYCAGQK